MLNSECLQCGGCPQRNIEEEQYRNQKIDYLKSVISSLKTKDVVFDEPIFIKDGQRRRAEMDFSYEKKELKIGFNAAKTHNIINITTCPMLDKTLNDLLPNLKRFLEEFCNIPIQTKIKKKFVTEYIKKGTIRLLKADNGIDILLIIDKTPCLNHQMLVADLINQNSNIIRFSWQINNLLPEVVVSSVSPKLYICKEEIDIPVGAFLQASKEAENEMIAKLLEYMGNTTGNIADLFCGLGTFTYPLSQNKNNHILSVDSSKVSLKGLEKALSKNQIHNVTVSNKNLFKFPLEKDELISLKALVMDPPRAGAHEQCRQFLELPNDAKPVKIIYISCNPQTFVYDADILIKANYKLEKVTLIDQFVYSKHLELIALFTLTPHYME